MSIPEDWADRCRMLARRIREHCLRMTHRGRSGHVGSMLSMAEILSVLYIFVGWDSVPTRSGFGRQ